jgi:hypothetical protein
MNGDGNFSLSHCIHTVSEAQSSLLSNGYWGLFPHRQSGRVVKLTTHLHLVPELKMDGAPPPPQFFFMAWYLVKHGQFYQLYIYFIRGREMKL